MLIWEEGHPTRRTAYATYTLIALNVLVALAVMAGPGLEQAVHRFGHIPARGGLLTLLTSQFMHGGLMHLLGNMYFLHVFGDNVEDHLGVLPYLGFYLAAGVIAALSQTAISQDSTIPLVGASGAIAGVMGLYAVLFPGVRLNAFILYSRVRMGALQMILLYLLFQFLYAGASLGRSGGGVAYWAHLGGLGFGFAAGAVWRWVYRK